MVQQHQCKLTSSLGAAFKFGEKLSALELFFRSWLTAEYVFEQRFDELAAVKCAVSLRDLPSLVGGNLAIEHRQSLLRGTVAFRW